jgi:hypothetical protein
MALEFQSQLKNMYYNDRYLKKGSGYYSDFSFYLSSFFFKRI